MARPDLENIRKRCEQASPHAVMASAISPKKLVDLLDYVERLEAVTAELVDQIETDHAHLMGDHEGAMDNPEVINLLRRAREAVPEACEMTHLQQYRLFLTAAGVKHVVKEIHGRTTVRVDGDIDMVVNPAVTWSGYSGFYFTLLFDSGTGKLLSVGARE